MFLSKDEHGTAIKDVIVEYVVNSFNDCKNATAEEITTNSNDSYQAESESNNYSTNDMA